MCCIVYFLIKCPKLLSLAFISLQQYRNIAETFIRQMIRSNLFGYYRIPTKILLLSFLPLYLIDLLLMLHSTVNSEIFSRVLTSRNFAYAKFRENKTLEKWLSTLSFTVIGKSCASRDFLTSQI